MKGYNYLDKEKGYIGSMQAIDKMAVKGKTKPEIIALQLVKENIPAINKYVIESGEIPEKNPIALAAQATLLHEEKIWDKVENDNIGSYEAAEREVLAEEQAAEDKGEISSFLGSILGIVFKAGSKALPKINEKRVAAGKRPLLAGEKGQRLLQKVNSHIMIEAVNDNKPMGKNNSAAGIFIDEVSNEVERQKTKEAIMKYLPYAIIGIVAIIYFARKSK